jgi:antitoxin MazE
LDNKKQKAEMEVTMTSENEILLRPLVKPLVPNEDLRAHMKMLLSKIKPNSSRHEENDPGIEGDELI